MPTWLLDYEPRYLTRALLRLERTMNLLEGGEGRMGERGWGRGGRDDGYTYLNIVVSLDC